MANRDHLAMLASGRAEWNHWRAANPDIRPDLSSADLNGSDLAKMNLREANLTKADLGLADLSDTRLSRANLSQAFVSRAFLVGADLRGADLRGADLAWSDLKLTNLCGADLWRANLEHADLFISKLDAADLRAAILMFAILRSCDCRGADMGGAILCGTTFSDTDLSEVKGLETARHRGPSTLGVDTLYTSNGKIPNIFLRRAGVPEALFSCGLSVGGLSEFFSCFVSYSHSDKLFAKRLYAALQRRGVRCWLDEHQILPGEDIYDLVHRGIREQDKLLLCCSKSSLTSWWVDDEICQALAKERALKRHKKKAFALIPLNLDGYLFKWRDGKAEQIRRRLAADFTSWERDKAKFNEQMERIVRTLRIENGS